MASNTNGVDRTIFAAPDFSDDSSYVKISPVKWTKIHVLATIQSLSMQIHSEVVKKISKKESKWALRWRRKEPLITIPLLERA